MNRKIISIEELSPERQVLMRAFIAQMDERHKEHSAVHCHTQAGKLGEDVVLFCDFSKQFLLKGGGRDTALWEQAISFEMLQQSAAGPGVLADSMFHQARNKFAGFQQQQRERL